MPGDAQIRSWSTIATLTLASGCYLCFISIGTAHWEQWLKDNHELWIFPYMTPAEVIGRMFSSLFAGHINTYFGFQMSLIIGCVLDFIGSIVMALPILLNKRSFAFLFCIGRLLDGITYPFFVVTGFNYIGFAFPNPEESKFYFASWNLGFMVSYCVGISIGSFVHSPSTAVSIMLSGPFVILLMLFLIFPPGLYPRSELPKSQDSKSNVFIHKLWIFLFVLAIYAMAWPIMFQIPYFAKNVHIEGHQSTPLLLAYPIGGFIGSILPFF